MVFFDRKEEVINIELTPYGKHLLSKGRWKPVYYEFYDDDIMYDSQYAGFKEGQDEIQTRISDSSRPKVQYSFDGADTRYKETIKRILESNSDFQNAFGSTIEKRKNLSFSSLPLANSSLTNDKNPAWSVDMFRGEIDSITGSVSIVGLPNNLHKLNLKTVNYRLSIGNREEEQQSLALQDKNQVGGTSDLNELHRTFDDETYVKVQEDYLLLYIKEENVDLLKENFDIMVYELETDLKTGQEIEKPLYFKKPKETIVNNILIDDEVESEEGYMGPEYVSHYFNIYTDKEINSDLLGKFLTQTEKKTLSVVDGYTFKEPQFVEKMIESSPQLESINGQQVEDFEDCE